MASSSAITQLKQDEGTRSKAYVIKGVLHIGIGFNLERGDGREQLILAGVSPTDVDAIMKDGGMAITDQQIDALFNNSLLQAESIASSYAGNWDTLPQGMRDVLVNMAFQLGPTGLREFKDMKKALDKRDWDKVKEEMADSQWASKKGTPKRAKRLISNVAELEPVAAPAPDIKVNPQASVMNSRRQSEADRMGALLSKQMIIDKMGKALAASQQKEETPAETAKPKMQKLEQGLFEDENGKKFFVDAKNRLLEIGEDNQPKAVIDPSTFDLSGVQ